MELDLISKTYPCRSQGVAVLNSRGGIHYGPVDGCFVDTDRPRGFLGAYCWFNGESLARELEAIGEKKMAKRCCETMSTDEAKEFGQRLLDLAEEFQGRYREVPAEKRPRISEWVSFYDEESKDWILKPYNTTIERVVDQLEKGGSWFQKVSTLGSGVAACF
jgi:hypothetical protein